MSKIEQSIHKRKTIDLAELIYPHFDKPVAYFTRKVADELRRRGHRVSLKYGEVWRTR